jgi:hypothetical protein
MISTFIRIAATAVAMNSFAHSAHADLFGWFTSYDDYNSCLIGELRGVDERKNPSLRRAIIRECLEKYPPEQAVRNVTSRRDIQVLNIVTDNCQAIDGEPNAIGCMVSGDIINPFEFPTIVDRITVYRYENGSCTSKVIGSSSARLPYVGRGMYLGNYKLNRGQVLCITANVIVTHPENRTP